MYNQLRKVIIFMSRKKNLTGTAAFEKAHKLTNRFIRKKTPAVWSGYHDLEITPAPDRIVPGCMVLEGGSFRGVYTSGVLDVLMAHGINMQTTVGTSAGALNGMNYVAGQIGRSAMINLGYRHDKRYFGLKSAIESHGVVGLNFILQDILGELPFDAERFYSPERRYLATAVNCETGEAIYWEKGKCANILKAVRASASMPLLSGMVNVDGIRCLDGGCAVKVPYQWALDQGFQKIIVVRTRPVGYRRKPESKRTQRLAKRVYRNFPKLAEEICTQDIQYNTACEELERLHAEGRIFMISPSEPVSVGAIEGDMEKLGELYLMGKRDAEAAMAALTDYLER